MAALVRVLQAARRPQRLNGAARRAMSTSAPPLPGFLPTLLRAGKRVLGKLDALSVLDSELRAFRADVRQEQMWWMLLQLHMPRSVDVDLAEFLEGAKVAAETQLRAVNSEEFAIYAAGRSDESDAADALADFCSPRAFKGIKQAARQLLEDRSMLLELQHVDVEAVQVTDIQYAQLTETQLEALMAGLPHLPLPWAADASVEYLQVTVAMRTTEVTKMTLVGVEEVLAQQTNVRTYKFATRANSSEELAWCIMDTLAVNESAKQLSRTVYDEPEPSAREAAADNDQQQKAEATREGGDAGDGAAAAARGVEQEAASSSDK